MKAERKMPRTGVPARASRVGCQHTSRHTSPEMAISRTLAKDRDRHPLKAPCLHLSQIGTSIVKKQKERGFKPPREAARSFNSREFCFEIWERESAPADYCLM